MFPSFGLNNWCLPGAKRYPGLSPENSGQLMTVVMSNLYRTRKGRRYTPPANPRQYCS